MARTFFFVRKKYVSHIPTSTTVEIETILGVFHGFYLKFHALRLHNGAKIRKLES